MIRGWIPCWLSWLVLFFALGTSSGWSAQTATVTAKDPVAFAKGLSHVKRPVQANEVFNVISVNGDEVTIRDAQGFEATLNATLLKITDSTPAPASVTPTVANVPTASPSAQTTNSAPAVTVPVASANSADADMIKSLNDTLQLPLFTGANLWDEDVDSVAKRLQWPQESRTAFDASYRRYAFMKEKQVTVLGARAYSMALYGRKGKPTYISIVFVNKGDFVDPGLENIKPGQKLNMDNFSIDKVMQNLSDAVKADATTIDARLTALLGTPETHVYGPTADSRETIHRWDWKGYAILFSAPRGEYAAIKIVPTDVADHFGSVDNLDRDAIKTEVAGRVLKRDNGDVILQEIPMVDQGPKGYCVPATWERYLRYVDVPADMYVLAMMGNTRLGGGTSLGAIRSSVDTYVESYGRRVEVADIPLDVTHISKFIDQGLPLMWGCVVDDDIEKQIDAHTVQRRTVTDWGAYKDGLAPGDKGIAISDMDRMTRGHMRMIIGYNAQTDELAISDSWGKGFTERWITVKEAQASSLGDIEYVQW